jgi:hypothetical protein
MERRILPTPQLFIEIAEMIKFGRAYHLDTFSFVQEIVDFLTKHGSLPETPKEMMKREVRHKLFFDFYPLLKEDEIKVEIEGGEVFLPEELEEKILELYPEIEGRASETTKTIVAHIFRRRNGM